MKCINCEHARQIGDKTRQDLVGCVFLSRDVDRYNLRKVFRLEIYEGYFYGGRRVGDIEPSDVFGKGAISLGLIVEADANCEHWSKIY